jgi:hypothetical protein
MKRASIAAIIAATLAPALSSCVAAALPIMVATTAGGMAFAGFDIYKVVQLNSGGTVRVAFGSGDGKTLPPPSPLPSSMRRVAIWPGDAAEVRVAERLTQSGRFSAVPPSTVARTLGGTNQLNTMTEGERSAAFNHVCRANAAQGVVAAIPQGETSNTGFFSLHKANVTFKADLVVYDCRAREIVWRDKIAIIVEVGGTTPSDAEILGVAGDAWADRLLQSPTGGPAHANVASAS